MFLLFQSRKLSLFIADVNWSEWSGKFKVKFDDVEFHESLGFRVGENGRPKFDLPIFTSPQPSSEFSAIRLTETTKLAIERA